MSERSIGIPVQNIRPGMYVAVHRSVYDDADDATQWTPFGPQTVRRENIYTGTPLKVLAVSPPFVCVTDGTERKALDTRQVGLIKLRRSYVKAFYGEEAKNQCREQRRGVEMPGRCPKCGSTFVVSAIERCSEGHRHRLAICMRCQWVDDLGYDGSQ